jgi:hypothetical protein
VDTPTFAWVADGPDEIRKVCRLFAARGRRSPEAQHLGRQRAAQQPLRAGRHDRRRGGGGHGDRPRRRCARVWRMPAARSR